jgi:transcription-repair coupling factor (superfamily II helicase)
MPKSEHCEWSRRVLLSRHRAELGEPGVSKLVEPPEGALALAAAEWAEEAGLAGCLYVARSESRAERLASAARGFAPDLQVIVLPAWDCLPYDRFSPSPSIMARRIAALADMAQPPPLAGRLVLATVESLLQRLPPASLSTDGFRVEVGMPLSVDELKIYLLRAGYVLDERVDEAGEAALRGTIDVFPGTDQQPFRLRVEEGVIAAIDRYDPVTQRTEFSIAEAVMSPVSEIILDESDVRRFLQGEEEEAEETAANIELWTRHLLSGPKEAPRRMAALEHWLPLFHERLHTVFELLPEARVILDPEVEERRDAWFEQVADAYEHRSAIARASRPAHPGQLQPLPPDRLYLDSEQWADGLRGRPILALRENGADAIDLGAAPVPRFADAGDPSRTLAQYIEAQRQAGNRVILAAADDAELRRLATVVERRLGAGAERLARWEDASALKPGAIAIAALDLAEGFAVPGWAVIAAPDVLPGAARLVASLGKAKAEVFASDALRVGDLVVHAQHGIGQVRGLEVLERDGAAHECLSLAYAGDQKLLVPAEEIGQLWRYGSADAGIALDRLSGDVWASRRSQVDAEVEETARALVQLADERARAAGPRLTAPAGRYRRFAARFPYRKLRTSRARSKRCCAISPAAGR